MLAKYKNEIICDLAESYGIYDYHAFSGAYIATLVSGLRPASRLYMAMSGAKAPQSELLLASILDGVNLIFWGMTEDGQKGRNKPERVIDALINKPEKPRDFDVYETPEDYERARLAILERIRLEEELN